MCLSACLTSFRPSGFVENQLFEVSDTQQFYHALVNLLLNAVRLQCVSYLWKICSCLQYRMLPCCQWAFWGLSSMTTCLWLYFVVGLSSIIRDDIFLTNGICNSVTSVNTHMATLALESMYSALYVCPMYSAMYLASVELCLTVAWCIRCIRLPLNYVSRLPASLTFRLLERLTVWEVDRQSIFLCQESLHDRYQPIIDDMRVFWFELWAIVCCRA